MSVLSWIAAHWVACASVVSMILGAVSMILHLIPSQASAAASVDAVKAEIDSLDGQAPKSG